MNLNVKSVLTCICCHSEQIKKIFNKSGFDYYRCQQCGLIFIYPIPTNSETIYLENYFTGANKGFGYVNYDKDKEAMKNVFIAYLEIIERFHPIKGSLLDIGAASGYFIDLACNRSWLARGIEISAYAAKLARKKGLDVIHGTIEGVEFPDRSFDVITLWDVLEHLPAPEKDLWKLSRWLKPGGLLAINTPDSNSLCSKILGKNWYLFIPPEHIFHYNKSSLNLLCQRLGFEPIIFTKIGKKYSISYIISVLQNWLKLKKIDKINNFINRINLGRLVVPLNFRDNFIAIFKKI